MISAVALAVVCAADTVDGIDVSKWQGTIDWAAVAGDGIRFAIIRTNHGLGDIDEEFDRNWAEARANGVIRGAYQYYLPGEDPIEQAELLLDMMGPLEPGDLPPTIDVEESAAVSPDDYAAGVRLWSDRVEAALGRKPMIYTGKYFWNGNVASPDFTDNPLWVAQWNVDCPDLPTPWATWTFHQTTSTGTVAGISARVDTDVFNGTYQALLAFAAAPSEPDAGPPDPPDAGPDPDPDPADPNPDAPPLIGCRVSSRGADSAPVGLSFFLAAITAFVARRRSARSSSPPGTRPRRSGRAPRTSSSR